MRAMTEEEFNEAQGQPRVMTEAEFNAAQNPQPSKGGFFASLKQKLNTPLASPEDVQKGLATAGNMDAANAAAMSFGLVKPPDQQQAVQNQQNPDAQALQGVSKGISNMASGLTTPANLGLIGASTIVPGIGLAAGATQVPSMIKNGLQGLSEAKEARESGDYQAAGEKYSEAITNLLAGASIGKGAANMGREMVAPTNPFSKAINPEVQDIAQSGYPLAADEITQSRPQQWLRKLFEKNPVTAQQFKDFGDMQRAALQSDVGQFQEGVGSVNNAEASQGAKQGLQGTEEAFRAKSKELFDKVSALSGDTKETMPNYSQALQSNLQNESDLQAAGLDSEALIKRLKTAHNDIIGDGEDPEDIGKTFDQMRRMRSRLYDLSDSSKGSKEAIGNAETRIYGNLAQSVEADMKNFSENQGGKLMDAYQTASQFYAPGKEDLNSPLAAQIRKMADESPNGLAKAIIQPGNDFRVQLAKRLLGDKFDVIKKQFTQNLIDDSTVVPKNPTPDEVAGAPKGIIQNGTLLKNIESYGPEVLKEVYDPDELKELNTLGSKSRLSQSAEKASGNATVAGRGMNPIKAVTRAAGGLAGYLPAKFMLSPFGRQLLSTQIPTAPGRVAFPLARALQQGDENEP